MPGIEKYGWTAIKKPEYVMGRLGATAAMQDGVGFAANRFAALWRENLSRAGAGSSVKVNFRTVTRGGKVSVIPVGPATIFHRPSKPGDPPAKKTGALAGSITVKQTIYTDPSRVGRVRFVVGTSLPYAAFLEWGVGPSRPFRHPAKQAERRRVQVGNFSEDGKRANEHDYMGGSADRPFTIEPRPHLRTTLRTSMAGVNQDMVVHIRGALAPPTLQKLDIRYIRRTLLKASAKLGSLQLFGINSRFLFLIRQRAIKAERLLGDYGAVIDGDMWGRTRRRIVGRNLGLQIGKIAGSQRADPRFTKAVKRQARTTLGSLFGFLIR